MVGLAIEILGVPRIVVSGEVADSGRFDRPHLLLYYLAAHAGIPCRRERLAELFWPEASPGSARLSLRQCLHKLRPLCGAAADSLVVDRTTVMLMAGPPCRVDVAALLDAVVDTATEPGEPGVLSLWRGPFLEGYPAERGLPAYDDWVWQRRRVVADRAVYLLEQAVEARRATGNEADALALVRRHRGILSGRQPRWLRELEAGASLPLPAAERAPGALERRPVTAVHLDPFAGNEEPVPYALVAEMDRLQALLTGHGGHVVPFPGGGLTAYFGDARGGDAESARALGAALDAMSGGAPWLRAGVATGVTLMTPEPAHPEATGEIARAAFDQARSAAAGEVRATDAVTRGLGDRFMLEADGPGWRVVARTEGQRE